MGNKIDYSANQYMEKRRMKINKQEGMGVIKFIFLTPVVLIGLVILTMAFSWGYKSYWDYRVEQLCAKDGGRTIYEVIKLSEDKLRKMRGDGQFIGLPARNYVKQDDEFFANSKTTIVHNGLFGLIIKRRVSRVIRLKDKKVLAEQITFSRVRGDFYPLPAVHHSSSSCSPHKIGFYDEVLIKGN